MSYKLTQVQGILQRLSDGAFIPLDLENSDYKSYLEWVSAGNTPSPADLLPELTPLQKIRAAEDAAENYMRKASRIATLDSALDKAMLDPRAAGKTREEVRQIYRQLNPTFRILDDLEIFCEAERKKIV